MDDFSQITWGPDLEENCRQLVRMAVREDLGSEGDITTLAIVSADACGETLVVSRADGVLAGLPVVPIVFEELGNSLSWQPLLQDGALVTKGSVVGRISGPVRTILAAERIILNFLGKLSGIATVTRQYVNEVRHTRAKIYDTRKTTPGWRLLEKYAVRCGGGRNHRLGLNAAVLIKDNHLAWLTEACRGDRVLAVKRAVSLAREFCSRLAKPVMVEIEVDDLQQLEAVLPERPDIVLLDNMSPAMLREAVALRNSVAPEVELEASGGIDLSNVRMVAETGIERISVGALTHKAVWLDLGLDWHSG
ncbi:Quinolinate phosphoribosyltransferase [decarboxylating] [Thermogutta terrifontis]|uniref:Probable nicotinate-nucleotide pyrophosphorylase [carboxylating] n=1 Tax=Thermogutta terrifontis TaxID=1331910 RepID=A0A286RG15_9BACT|nr:carboxylating nicotinate-nucleotide diphosphorylase [Thermogutta terrifontis]ASV74911.1 Quinolinate phosphoribosyltransferase [decarboxylating] [Thermogutta terrifontis]